MCIFKINSMKNLGYIERPEKDEDYFAGVNSPIEYKIVVFDGDFTTFNSPGELQKQNGVETMSCVSQSGYGGVEPQLNLMLSTDKMPKATSDFFYNNGFVQEGKIRLSKHALAILSETMPNGNYVEKVANTIKNVGLIPAYLLEFGASATWDEYMDESHITEEMLAIGEESKKYITIQYEWVITPSKSSGKTIKELADIMLYHEKQAPLQVAKSGHATYLYNGVTDLRHNQRDSYKPFDRTKPYDWNPPYVMKIVATLKSEFTKAQIEKAKKRVLEIIPYAHKDVRKNQSWKFFRPDLHGEAYWINPVGSFKYKTAKGTGFKQMIDDKEIIPLSEIEWERFRPAEIK